MRCSFVSAGGEAGPVVEVDDADLPVVRHNAVAAVNLHIESLRSLLADSLQVLEVEFQALRLSVDNFVAIFAVALVEGVEPIEEWSALHAVELDEVAHQVLVDNSAGDAALYQAKKKHKGSCCLWKK